MNERQGLIVSAGGNLFMAGLGLGFALWAGSDAIMFDAFFSGVQFVMVLVNMYIASLLARRATPNYQFGYAAFEPLVITLRGAMILAGSAYAFWMAVAAILEGGRELAMGIGVLYAVVASAGGFAIGFVVDRIGRSSGSPILALDARTWLVDGFLSLGVALAFGVGYLVAGTRFEFITPYIDPGLVILLVLAFLAIPFRTMREGLRGLLGAAPDPELQSALEDRAGKVLRPWGLDTGRLRMARMGRMLYILHHVLLPSGAGSDEVETGPRTVGDLDRIRDELETALQDELEAHGVPRMEIDTVFTAEERWLEL
jgi:predicted Co/Zn/Cd cation transporter (cation efflux family)